MTYKLDKINRRIIYELDKNARISDSQLARIVKRSREAVRNRINKLVADGVIQAFITSINPSKFGYRFFKLYFQLANIPEERERFYTYLKQLPGLYWFGGNDGVWDLHGTFYARSASEFNTLKNRISTDFKHLILRKSVGMLVNVRQYAKKYLIETIDERPEPVMFADEVIENPLDALDRTILNHLAHNARLPIVELARRCKETATIVRRRMRRLEETKIILQYRVAIDHPKLGYEMFKAFIYMHNLSEEDERRLVEYAKQHMKILYLIRQLSDWDIEVEIMAKNYAEFTEIINDLRQKFANIIRNYEFCLMREDIFLFGEKDMF